MNRKNFIISSVLAGGSLFRLSNFKKETESPIFEIEEISEFVGAAHNSFEDTKKIIEAKPLILNCSSQLAKGDFETAIGGAAHMGRRDIADLLVSHGARLDIFSLTFLGFTDMVKGMIEKHPNLLNSYGPHGFTLLHHAKVGKHAMFTDWLLEQGLDKTFFNDVFKK